MANPYFSALFYRLSLLSALFSLNTIKRESNPARKIMNNTTAQEMLANLRATVLPTYIFTGIFAIGFIGNFLVCLTIFRINQYHTSTYILIASMAVSDAFGCLFLIIYTVISIYLLRPNDLSLSTKEILCDFLGVCSYSSYFTSTHTLTMISIDRYYAFVKAPFKPLLRNPWRIKLAVVLTWVFGFLVALPIIPAGGIDPNYPFICDSTHASLLHNQIYFMLILVIEEIIPAVIIVYAYVCVIKALNRSSFSIKGNVVNNLKNLQKRKSAIRKIVIVTAVFLVLTAILHITRLAVALTNATVANLFIANETILGMITNICYGIAFLQPVVNPIIFCVMSKSFRKSIVNSSLKRSRSQTIGVTFAP
ncbi:uncharacterized protein TRIADDRAFT_56808 [Trichoplax adhaerens]|uniref:G-protein coupled receptors family 1 profile domain-containing protein n=1 Tax=Trichoplax adhaerens TaxID=10228 RepID=B3RWM3_TRIAD|nr:hypothetical protein TRIADDRAFT_56808 [Trichoplax adhaerens]EDV25157.1 hypothetical protein TRIADDRAFT_56808 [Trichoplax adhaerens]|eukprot:XP_002113047.1 hypothetical protein TRIADDRAFT_56808 [Trichoplax adhaerens]